MSGSHSPEHYGVPVEPPPRSATGKRLSGANARRRLQARRRAVLLNAFTGTATFEFWVTKPHPAYTQAFDALRDAMRSAMRSVANQCA